MITKTRFSATTHVGHKRKINEDSVLALPDLGIWVVSDGMGGHSAGDYASRVVVDSVAMMNPDPDPAILMTNLRGAFTQAHETIVEEGIARGGSTIGATVVTLMLANSHFAAFWAGDSRLYRLQSGGIELLTIDHSTVADLVVGGHMTWDEAEAHPQSNAVTRAVGVGDTLELDKIRGETFPGDRFLLCSDGLTKYATFGTLETILNNEPIDTVTDTLLEFALRKGGADNISIIVVDVV